MRRCRRIVSHYAAQEGARPVRFKTAFIISAFCAALATPATATCPGRVAVQVLGSGGPLADDARASAGYLLWVDGQARLLIDAGGGVFQRFGAAGARMTTLDAILISHLHADHVSDLAALLKSASFDDASAPLRVVGPSAGAVFPGIAEFLAAHFDARNGAYRYLSRLLDVDSDGFRISPVEIDATGEGEAIAFTHDEIGVRAIPVNHGDVPALAFAVSIDGASVVFAGDQSAFSEGFEQALGGARPDLLIAHHAISGAKGQPRGLHRDPASIGDMAAALGAKRLVLSHNMKRALDDWRAGRKAIRAAYDGPVEIAEDGECFSLRG
ncbi:MAG TPA: MBL fold metallo-hydrolase [Parvularcula sp.]|nr:MBL fold metallo-hydrolase [Parvularcula sp.]